MSKSRRRLLWLLLGLVLLLLSVLLGSLVPTGFIALLALVRALI